MDGKVLNYKVKDICAYDSNIDYDAFGGKPIPYIGWYWRSFNFDNFDRLFGIIPAKETPDGKPIVGFMENNKWDYDYVQADEEEWREIRQLLEIAVDDPTNENLNSVHVAIQNLHDEERLVPCEYE